MIEEGTILIDTEGAAVGQANGLSVYDLGDYAFGKPSRVTAKVFLGKEGLVNIEREAEARGRIHNKGVLILQGYFGSRYAQRFPSPSPRPSASEQFLRRCGRRPAPPRPSFFRPDLRLAKRRAAAGRCGHGFRQSAGADPGRGRNQPEDRGFYKTCKVKGLTGAQGVIIPAANVKNLMLDPEVVEAVGAGSVPHLPPSRRWTKGWRSSPLSSGEEDARGDYPNGTLNAR